MTSAKKIKYQISRNIIPIILVAIILLIVINPQVSMSAFYTGLTLWATKVLPSLLPFFILTKMLTNTRIVSTIGKLLSPITKKLYGVGGVAGYIYLMSIISGYPVGAKLTSELYLDGKIDSEQASTITSFASTSGPLFMLGTVGVGIYHSARLGICILFAHLIGALINGLFFRHKSHRVDIDNNIYTSVNKININDIISSSITSILTIGGFIALAYMLVQTVLYYNGFILIDIPLSHLGIPIDITHAILSGLIEVTSGAVMLSICQISLPLLGAILTFLISFGGLSIHAQAYVFLSSFNMPYRKFLLQKICHAIISTILIIPIIHLL